MHLELLMRPRADGDLKPAQLRAAMHGTGQPILGQGHLVQLGVVLVHEVQGRQQWTWQVGRGRQEVLWDALGWRGVPH